MFRAMRPLFLVLISSMLVSCDIHLPHSSSGGQRLVGRVQSPATIASQATNPSKEPTNPAVRAEYIRERIEKYKEWGGGHSPVPRRAINANTLAKVRQEIGPGDLAALMILLQDDASDIRSLAASLLACTDPNAQSELEDRINKESNIDRKYFFIDALITVKSIREGRTSCK